MAWTRLKRSNAIPLLLFLIVIAHGGISRADGENQAKNGLNPGQTLIPLRAFFLQKPYLDTQFASQWWEFGGSTVIEINKHVRLTQDLQSQAGWIFSRVPFTSTNWQLEFEFHVSGKGLPVFGDGFAFWFVAEKGAGPVFGARDNFNGLGIFFDTYANDESRRSYFPYVMAMVGDGKTSYDKDMDGKANEVGGCTSDFRGKGHPTRARVRYSRDDQELTVDLAVNPNGEFEQCFKANEVLLPMVGYIGFSAHTGEVSDNHDIVALASHGVVNTGKPLSRDPPIVRPTGGGTTAPLARNNKLKTAPPSGAKSSGGGWWRVIVALLVIGGAIAGIVSYFRLARGKSAKRF
ncbi:lectin [Gonapodya prolifera JEL478]|uniref:Lectin n=1 Tax=Gonapodya prolifera (strain JEL478) TaxID=1344416 RepID=A0A139APM1_GONPJ|nr:lectin [Gonapodya prolifera JEL478]|eukprot:KXS18686.1 lectin [Gonapodya prolifera JEL478]